MFMDLRLKVVHSTAAARQNAKWRGHMEEERTFTAVACRVGCWLSVLGSGGAAYSDGSPSFGRAQPYSVSHFAFDLGITDIAPATLWIFFVPLAY